MARKPHYQEDRDLIISTLSAAGWALTRDGDLTETVDLEHEGKTFTPRVQHFSVSDTRGFNLFITHPDGRELLYMVEYDDHLVEVLNALVELGDNADEKNLAKYLDRLHQASAEMYIYEGDQPVALSDLHVGGAISSRIAQALSAAGWSFADDNDADKPDLVYSNRALSLEVIQSDANPSKPTDFAVYLILGRSDHAGLSLIVYYENQLDALLRHIVNWQDQVSATNFREFVGGVVQLCPQTFVLINDEPMKLVEDVPVNALQLN